MVISEQHLYQTIALPRKLETGSMHNFLLCYCPVIGIHSIRGIENDKCFLVIVFSCLSAQL